MTTSITLWSAGQRNNQTEFNAATTGVGPDSWSVRVQRLHGGLSDGVDVVFINNGRLTLAVLPTRGMGIWYGQIDDLRLGWNSPVRNPVHPTFVDEMRRGGIGWLDGFNELICRCGLGWNGAPGDDGDQFLPLHGRVANLPAHEVSLEVSDDGLSLTGVVDEASVFGGFLQLTSVLSTSFDSTSFSIADTVANRSSSPADAEMLYHCNVGRPFLGDGAQFMTAAREMAPRDERAAEDTDGWQSYRGPEHGYAEQVYFYRPISDADGQGLAVLQSPEADKAVAVRFDTSALPWLTQWKNTQAEEDGYCTGLEPATGFPNVRSYEREQGRVVQLDAGQDVTFRLSMEVACDGAAVKALADEVDALQGDSSMEVHATPRAGWSG